MQGIDRERRLARAIRGEPARWLRAPGVTSVAIAYKTRGGKLTNELAVRFTVGQKLRPERLEAIGARSIPTYFKLHDDEGSLGEIPTDIIERTYTRSAQLLVREENFPKLRRSRVDPIQPGVSVCHHEGTAGSIGAIVFDSTSGEPLLLSNWHVLDGGGALGDEVLQPGPHDLGTSGRDRVGRLRRSHLGLAGDCAVSSIEGRSFDRVLLELGVIPRRMGKVDLGDKVVKSGRTTGVTYGVVSAVGLTTRIEFAGVGLKAIGGFEIQPDPNHHSPGDEISMGGDSGSLWMLRDDQSDVAVGLHFAGEARPTDREHAVACNIHSVMAKLGVTFDEQAYHRWRATRQDSLGAMLSLILGRSGGAGTPDSFPRRNQALQAESRVPEGMKLKIYGNWCGPGHGGGAPIDDVDAACRAHDQCYDLGNGQTCGCDAQLIDDIGNALRQGHVRPAGRPSMGACDPDFLSALALHLIQSGASTRSSGPTPGGRSRGTPNDLTRSSTRQSRGEALPSARNSAIELSKKILAPNSGTRPQPSRGERRLAPIRRPSRSPIQIPILLPGTSTMR